MTYEINIAKCDNNTCVQNIINNIIWRKLFAEFDDNNNGNDIIVFFIYLFFVCYILGNFITPVKNLQILLYMDYDQKGSQIIWCEPDISCINQLYIQMRINKKKM